MTSAGRDPHVSSDAAVEALRAWTQTELCVVADAIREEQRRRAREEGDMEAVAAAAFNEAFDNREAPRSPYIEGPYLVVPGAKHTRSTVSHISTFGSASDADDSQSGVWVWQSPDCVHDEIRNLENGTGIKTVTLLPATEGMTIDMVTTETKSGRPSKGKTVTFKIVKGVLTQTGTRVRQPGQGSAFAR